MGREAVKIAPDTNLLVRIAVRDDWAQARAALKMLKQAEVVAISTLALSEFVWVLTKVYKFSPREIAAAISTLVAAENVAVDRVAVDAGTAALMRGADFADGVIAFEGARLGGETFISLDRKAVSCIAALGRKTVLLGH